MTDLECGTLTRDLLAGWYEDWVLIERERFRQLRLHALEAICERLVALGRFGEAVEAGLAAVAGEPLRESAHRALIQAYLAEGNPWEGVRQFRSYAQLLREELGAETSPMMRDLVQGLQTG
jgi:DNA-binding SARP family transcriptional activator